MSLTEIKAQPNQELISMLESLVEKAKSGQMQSAAVCVVNDDCSVGNCFVGSFHPIALVGELRVVERDIIDICVDTRRKPLWECCE